MAKLTYTVKRGDNVWSLAAGKYGADYAAAISGNTIAAKEATVIKLNNLKRADYNSDVVLIYPGQVLLLSQSGGSTNTSSSNADWRQVSNIRIGLESANDTSSKNRAVFADWSYSRSNLGKYKYRWLQYLNGKWVLGAEGETTSYESIYCYSTFTADADATKVRFAVQPIAATKKDSKGNETYYWTDGKWSSAKEYDFSNNPPLTPPVPTVSIDNEKLILTATISSIVASELDAVGVKFNIVQDNSVSIHTTPSAVTINTTSNYVSYQYAVEPGHIYTVRACSVNSKKKESGWSDFSGEEGTKPSAPTILPDKCRRNKRTDGTISAYLEWTAVANATSYKIEYTTVKSDFENAPDNVSSRATENARTSLEITDIETGADYFFRVRAVNDNGESDPTDIVTIPIGTPPAAPTTYSSASSAFVGETMELHWIHNPTDNSKQTYAQLRLKINDGSWLSFMLENTTDDSTTGNRIDETNYTYGTSVSYKGNLYFKLDTTHADLKNAKIQWQVITAGVTDSFSEDENDWSTVRTIYIYEKPKLNLSMTSDLAGTGELITTLTGFPFYIRAQLSLTDYSIQRPVGYHLQIVSNEYYVTVDDIGQTKTVNPGDAVYSKYFDTSETLVVEMSANNIDLESGISYTVHCAVDMSTGLAVTNHDNLHNFTVSWVDVEYVIDADVTIDAESYAAMITPHCTTADDELVENVTISVYRREYDGSYKEIASGIPNNGTAVTDPHPALDYARYRLVAKDTQTGAISFYDAPGCPVNGFAAIIQWAEEWSTFDLGESTSLEGPSWSGSLLKLPYNIKITDTRKRDVTLVEYVGREHPVSYYGTQLGESSKWSMEIPADDDETIYALRRLSRWSGDVYVREPSGIGFWANVEVSFDKSYDSVVIPISIAVTRVEGGV